MISRHPKGERLEDLVHPLIRKALEGLRLDVPAMPRPSVIRLMVSSFGASITRRWAWRSSLYRYCMDSGMLNAERVFSCPEIRFV
jgi:hypothetical protein